MLPVSVQDAIRTRNTRDFSGTMPSVDSGNDKYTKVSKCRNAVVNFGDSLHFSLRGLPVKQLTCALGTLWVNGDQNVLNQAHEF